jgi:hypothetical protein
MNSVARMPLLFVMDSNRSSARAIKTRRAPETFRLDHRHGRELDAT